jgi:N-acetylmuramoyl-L-alanine amidase
MLHMAVPTQAPASFAEPTVINSFTTSVTDTADPIILSQPVTEVNWVQVFTYAYLAIAALLLFKLLIDIAVILYKAIKYGEQQNGYCMVPAQKTNNSSFFKYIFLNSTGLSAIEKEQVIAHEIIHVQKLHSVDNLFTEALKALLWFNPFVYFFAKALHQAHEFEVDRCLTTRYNSKSYAGLLLKLSVNTSMGLANQFSAYGLKTRIKMLFNKPSAAIKKLSYLLTIPVMGALVYFLCIDKVYAYKHPTPADDFVLVLDAGHGGKDKGAIAKNGVSEKYLCLSIVKQIKAIAEARGIKTVLTRSDDRFLSLQDRVKFKGDIFVSVHINSMHPTKEWHNNNGIVILTDKETNAAASQKLAGSFETELQHLNGIGMGFITNNQRLYILRKNPVPAVAIELGYLTNKSDLAYITNKNNQHDVAEKFVDAVVAYKTQYSAK